MVSDVFNNTNIYVFRDEEPIYTKNIKKRFFKTIEKQIESGTKAIYTVKENYITPLLRIEVVCKDKVTAKDIEIFTADIRGYREQPNLSDEQRMATWRKAKELYNTQQTKMQEPQYWCNKLEELKKQKHQATEKFVDDILNVLYNTEFLPGTDWDARYYSSSDMCFYGYSAPYIYEIKRYGYEICYYEEHKQITILNNDEKKSILFVLPDISYTQAKKFISVCKSLYKLKTQQRLLVDKQKDLEKSITNAKKRYDEAKQTNHISGRDEFIQKIR